MKFVVDGMLGRFSRWLRMLGCEVKYFNNASDDELLEVAEMEKRILLTRDLELFRRAKNRELETFFVDGRDEPEKLAHVAERFNIKLEVDTSISRCPTCNSSIKQVEKSEILDKVPKGTLKHYDEFWICLGCGKVYWQGGHWKKINETLTRAKELLEVKGSQTRGKEEV